MIQINWDSSLVLYFLLLNMLALYILGFSLILESSGRQEPGTPPGIVVYRTATPGQYLLQPVVKTTVPVDIPQGYSQIAVVVVPRHPGPILQTRLPPRAAPEPPAGGFNQDPGVYYGHPVGRQESPQNVQQPQNLAYAHLLPYPPLKKKLYPKEKINVHQFLKEVTPTTQTAYSEQQAASLRYAQATPPQAVEQDVQKLPPQRVAPQPLPVPYIIQSETQQNANQPQPYQQIIHPQQYVHPQQNIQVLQNIPNQQYVQPQSYPAPQLQYAPREEPVVQQPKYQQPHLQPQNTPSGLTYIPINPVRFQRPLVDDDTPAPKSAIHASQKTSSKKYQLSQPTAEEEADDNPEKAEVSSRKTARLQPQQYFPVQPQQVLLPLKPQQVLLPLIPQQPAPLGEAVQTQIQPQLLKYQPIQQLHPEVLKYQQIQPQPVPAQPVYLQVRPKKGPQQLLRQQTQHHIVAYQQIPLQQPLQVDSYAEQRTYQQLQPTVRYLLQPQIIPYQQVQPENLRVPQIQPESVDYEPVQDDGEQQQDLQQQVDRTDEKSDIQLQEAPQRQTTKVKKPNLRSRKYRPSATVQHQNEEESQSENQENHQDNQEEFRIQYPDGLKSQASSYSRLRHRRPLQTNSRFIGAKDRAVQIIDEENEEYK